MIEQLTDFSRIEAAVDMHLMQNAHIVCVGTGGAYSLLEGLCRSGIGQLTLIDPDVVEESNVVRQGFELADIGRPKVEALAEHLRRVNGRPTISPLQSRVQGIDLILKEAIFKSADLILFLTDSFAAQAFGNRLALHYGKPAIWGGFYDRSRGGEIYFSIPGVTKNCFRCVMRPRYEAYAEHGEPKQSSQCNTMFHSMFLDSLLGMLSMAILHRNTDGLEYSGWLCGAYDRNVIQFKVHPGFDAGEGNPWQRVFAGSPGWCFNSAWQRFSPPEEEAASCPDCGGTGLFRSLTERTRIEP